VETLKLITDYGTKLKFILSRNKQRAPLLWGKEYFASTSTQANIQPRRTLKYFGEVLYIYIYIYIYIYVGEFYGGIF